MTELELLDKAATKRVLFLGEEIIDVYHYVKPLGRPTKDAIISVELVRSESFEGGITAAAEHAKGMVANTTIAPGGTKYTKERFVEESHFHKLFQCYRGTEKQTSAGLDGIGQYEVVAVIDYGHGMATKEFINDLRQANFLAINVQTNSGNYGFNLH